jgi:hypothetical protein
MNPARYMGTYYSYNCLSCGTREYMQSKVRRCNFCAITLCRRCKVDGVCPRDHRVLLPEERNKLNSTSYLIDNGCGCSIGTCFLVVFLGLWTGMMFRSVTLTMGFAVFILISMSIGFIAGGKTGKKKVMGQILIRLDSEVASIKQPYTSNPGPFISPSAFIPEPSLNFGTPMNARSSPEAESKYCTSCGGRVDPIAGEVPRFCPNCGSAV